MTKNNTKLLDLLDHECQSLIHCMNTGRPILSHVGHLMAIFHEMGFSASDKRDIVDSETELLRNLRAADTQ